MASEAIVRCPLLLMTIDAKPHRVIDGALRHGHLRQVAVTGRALDLGADVRRMIEPHVRFFEKSVNALPRHVLAASRVVAQRLNARIRRIADIFMTGHAEVHARYAGPRPALDAAVTLLALDSNIVEGMNFMREFDRLMSLRLDTQKMSGRIAESRVRGRERGTTPSLRGVWIRRSARITRDVGLRTATHDRHQKHEESYRPGARVRDGLS